ncbi:hypothetical protein ATO13_23546 [Stappia sp. 22II-S9-Z10]|nr:hypothetical protein ATO13_23546 [Stappia sp. 22II-S9-Z10]
MAQAYLRAGFGGIVLCAKPGEADLWRKLAKECGRAKDLVFFDDSGGLRFNFLDYAQHTIAAGGKDMNLVQLLSTVAEASRAQSGGGGGNEETYFRDAANQLVANAIPFLRIANGSIRLKDLHAFINSSPRTREEARSDAWRNDSYCGRTMMRVYQRGKAGDMQAARVFEEHRRYWLDESSSLGDKTRGSIISTLTSSIYPFLSGQLHDLFCTDTNILPEYARQGVIIVLDLPARSHGVAGVVAQQIFKLAFQLCMEAEHVSDKTRPVMIWADECQFFMNSHDTDHLSVCRQQRVANVFITQDMPTYQAKIGNEKEAESLLNKFGTRIFHATTDYNTSKYAADIIGRIRHYTLSESQSRGASSSGGDSLGETAGSGTGSYGVSLTSQQSKSSYLEYDIQPDYFAKQLRTGGKPNNHKVDGIVIRNGMKFKSSGNNRIKAEFSQL